MKRRLVLLFCLLFAFNSFSGQGSGNGGDIVVCTNDRLKTYELLDYYEGRNDTGEKMKIPDGKNEIEIAKKIIEYPAFGKYSHSKFNLRETIANIEGIIVDFYKHSTFVNEDLVDLPDHADIYLDTGCEIKQLVIQNADLSANTVKFKIDNKLWKKLNIKQKAGVIVHEAIYNQALSLGHENSMLVRKAHISMLNKNYQTQQKAKGYINILTQDLGFLKQCTRSELYIPKKYKNWAHRLCFDTYLGYGFKVPQDATPAELRVLAKKYNNLWNSFEVRINESILKKIQHYTERIKEFKKLLRPDNYIYNSVINYYLSNESPKKKILVVSLLQNIKVEHRTDFVSAFIKDFKSMIGYRVSKTSSSPSGSSIYSQCSSREHVNCFYKYQLFSGKGAYPITQFMISNFNYGSLGEELIDYLTSSEAYKLRSPELYTVMGKLNELKLLKRVPLRNFLNIMKNLVRVNKPNTSRRDYNPDSDYNYNNGNISWAWLMLYSHYHQTNLKELETFFFDHFDVLFKHRSLNNYFYEELFKKKDYSFSKYRLDKMFNSQNFSKIMKNIKKFKTKQFVFADYLLSNYVQVNEKRIFSTMYENLFNFKKMEYDYNIYEAEEDREQLPKIIVNYIKRFNRFKKYPKGLSTTILQKIFKPYFKKVESTELVLDIFNELSSFENLSREDRELLKKLSKTDRRASVRKKALDLYQSFK